MRFVNEPTEVEIRVDADGTPVPQTFTWRGRRLAIADVGRRWESEIDGTSIRHFLVMIATGDRFELTQHTGTGRWRVVRTWEHLARV